jgi:hypothetical protein
MISILTYFIIVDTYLKFRENLEHQYWPDQSRALREYNPYWQSCTNCDRQTTNGHFKLEHIDTRDIRTHYLHFEPSSIFSYS